MNKELNLMLHAGADSVTRNDIVNAETPTGTRTHQPIPHWTLLEQVTAKLRYHNYSVVNESHGLTKDGNRYFGMLQLSGTADDHSIIVGLRNSHDKRFPAAIAAGSGVFVCDNLAFSGEIKVARKHTVNILRDLPRVVGKAVSRLADHYHNQEQQFAAYKTHRLTDDRARSMMVEGVKTGVIGCTHLPAILNEWENPTHDEFSESNVWRLFNAVTEVAKTWSMDQSYKRTQLLHGLCNSEVGLAV